MANQRKNPLSVELKTIDESVTAEEIAVAFREMVKWIPCPNCAEAFTDAAVDWGDAWSEGRRAATAMRNRCAI